jgi:hypothetical protein
MEIRRGAPLEIPHILLLIDDEADALFPALAERAKSAPPLYETPLHPDAGFVTGWPLDKTDDWGFFAGYLEKLAARARTRYGVFGGVADGVGDGTGDPFLFAVGDGNHSLATAKAVWEEYKQAHRDEPDFAGSSVRWTSPRWALVELENLYDPGISFEPIHRLVFGVTLREIESLLAALPGFTYRPVGNRAELVRLVSDAKAPRNRLGLIAGTELLLAETDEPGLSTAYLQPLLDAFLGKRNAGSPKGGNPAAIDYIHGEAELFRLAASGGARGPAGTPPAVGILLPPVKKSGLFETVARTGPLPRKSFSMGEGIEKRYYLESRRVF